MSIELDNKKKFCGECVRTGRGGEREKKGIREKKKGRTERTGGGTERKGGGLMEGIGRWIVTIYAHSYEYNCM